MPGQAILIFLIFKIIIIIVTQPAHPPRPASATAQSLFGQTEPQAPQKSPVKKVY